MANNYEDRLIQYYKDLKLDEIMKKEEYEQLTENKEKNFEIVKNYVINHTDIYYKTYKSSYTQCMNTHLNFKPQKTIED